MSKVKNKPIKIPSELTYLRDNIDQIVVILVIVLSFLFWKDTANIPYFWDSAGFVVPAARKLLETNFKPLIPTGSDFAHPPFYIGLLAFAWKIFGDTIFISHVFNFIFLPVLLISTYFIGKKIKNWQLGVAATTLVAFTPVVLAEYGIIYLDLSMAALLNVAIALWFYDKHFWGSVILSLAVLTKLPAILALSILFALFFFNKKLDKKFKTYIPFIIPIITLIAWLIYHKTQTGWLYKSPERATAIPQTISQLLLSLKFIINILFINQGRWLILLGISFVFFLNIKKLSKKIFSLSLFILLGVLFFSIFSEFTDRYSIFLLPSIYICSLYLVFEYSQKIKKNYVFWIYLFSCVYFFYQNIYPIKPETSIYTFSPPSDLTYRDMIDINIDMSKFLQTNHSLAQIYGNWPENYQLQDPYQGYVKQALNFDLCQNFKLNPNLDQIVVLHPYSPGQMLCRQLMDQYRMKPINRFVKNGTWLELYMISKDNQTTPSAELAPQQNL